MPAALASLGVQPGARFSGAELQSVERRTTSDDVWWLYNPTDAPVATTGSFATTGRPYRLDLWNGTGAPVAQYAASARAHRPADHRSGARHRRRTCSIAAPTRCT